ncbi:KTSC domain-containing protein, partial [Pantoea vagans]|uniref:KTSC domain-containing protein n=1 Tax=Pantoea vagans TaxID=470934 RepID=UPI0023B08142
MNRHNVTSALFSSAGYDATTGVLELEYRNGACRRWLAVPPRVYQAFCAAADSDAFFRTRIEGRYLSVRGSLSLRRGRLRPSSARTRHNSPAPADGCSERVSCAQPVPGSHSGAAGLNPSAWPAPT